MRDEEADKISILSEVEEVDKISILSEDVKRISQSESQKKAILKRASPGSKKPTLLDETKSKTGDFKADEKEGIIPHKQVRGGVQAQKKLCFRYRVNTHEIV